MSIQRRLFSRLVARLAAAALVSATCLGGAAAAKPLVHAIPADIASLDPADIRGQQDQEIGVNVYERLVQIKFNEQPDGIAAGRSGRGRSLSLPSRGRSRVRSSPSSCGRA